MHLMILGGPKWQSVTSSLQHNSFTNHRTSFLSLARTELVVLSSTPGKYSSTPPRVPQQMIPYNGISRSCVPPFLVQTVDWPNAYMSFPFFSSNNSRRLDENPRAWTMPCRGSPSDFVQAWHWFRHLTPLLFCSQRPRHKIESKKKMSFFRLLTLFNI